MQLRLTVVRDPRRTLGDGASHVFSEAGGTIGRSSSCDLVLSDAANVISSRHAEIAFNGRGFTITDTSTNGVYLNRTDAPLGRGNSGLVASGDVLYLGDLVFKITVEDDARDSRARLGLGSGEGWTKAQQSTPSRPPSSPAGFEGLDGARPGAGTDPLAGFAPARRAVPGSRPEVKDPLVGFDPPNEPQDDLLGSRAAPRQNFVLPPFPAAAPRPTLAAARQAPSTLTFPGSTPSNVAPSNAPAEMIPADLSQPNVPPPSVAPVNFAPPNVPPANIPPARAIPAAWEPSLNDPLYGPSNFSAAPNPPSAGPIPDLGVLLPDVPLPPAAAPEPFMPLARQDVPAAPLPPAPVANMRGNPPLPPATMVPDDFLAHLVGLPGFQDPTLLPQQPETPPAQMPRAPSQPQSQSSSRSAPPPAAGQRSPLPPDYAASLVSLGRKEARGDAASPIPALDPVSVLRRRGEARPDQQASRGRTLVQPPAAPRLPSSDVTGLPAQTLSAPGQAAGQTPSQMPGQPSGQVPSQMPGAPAARSRDGDFAEFWQILGLDVSQIDPARRAEILAILAATIRESVNGLVEVLSARNAIKDEFRMDRTRLQPDENNPLKFFQTGHDALQRALIERTPGFLSLDIAARRGFSDIKAHEVASMTALQRAMIPLVQRLAPTAIEQAAGQSAFGRKADKAKLWDQFVELYNRFADTLEFSVPEIVSHEFARAYHEQIDQMNQGEPR